MIDHARRMILASVRGAMRWRYEERRRAFRSCFLGADERLTQEGEVALADLKRFCKVTDSSFVPGDPYATALNEGRREVFNRIVEHLYLSDEMISRMVEQSYPDEAGDMGNDED